MRIYLDYILFGFNKLKAYPWEIPFTLLAKLVKFGAVMLLWQLIFSSSQGGVVSELSLEQLLSYYLVTDFLQTYLMAVSQKFGSVLRRAVKYGDMNNYLVKPVNVIPVLYSQLFGFRVIENISSLISLVVAFIIYPPASAESLLFFLAYLPIAWALGFSINLLEGVLAFHFTEASGIMNSVSHVIKIMGGYWLPIYVFPLWLKNIAESLPFLYMGYGPYAMLDYEKLNVPVVQYFIVGAVWAVIFNAVVFYFWRRGLKAYEGIGI